jgi:hypothetical protein
MRGVQLGLYHLYGSFTYFVEICPSINATVAPFTLASWSKMEKAQSGTIPGNMFLIRRLEDLLKD